MARAPRGEGPIPPNLDLGDDEEHTPVLMARKPVGMPKTVRIIVEENDEMPPSGLPLGLNGTGYTLLPGVEADVPLGILGILNDAKKLVPRIDPYSRRITGWHPRLRFPYTVVPTALA